MGGAGFDVVDDDFRRFAYRLDDTTVFLVAGTWSSFNGAATDSATSDHFTRHWYEEDFYAGAGVTTGKWTFQGSYMFETSPSDAFQTVEHADLKVTFDDSTLLGAWSLLPTVLLLTETGPDTIDGGRPGTYLQLGFSPSVAVDGDSPSGTRVTFPATVGLSLSNYYEGLNGENDVFGFASVGAVLSIPLDFGKSAGAWTFRAGVQGMFFGDATSTFNDDDHFELITTVSLSIEF